jgi:hypothetical protein
VVADVGLGRRREDRLRERGAVEQPLRQRDAAHRAGLAVVDEPASGEVAAGHALDGLHDQPTAQHRAAAELVCVRRELRGVVVDGRGHEVVGHQVRELAEPPQGQAGEHRALVRDRGREHDVVRRDPVGGHQEQVVVVDGVELADLAAGDQRERERRGHVSAASRSNTGLRRSR